MATGYGWSASPQQEPTTPTYPENPTPDTCSAVVTPINAPVANSTECSTGHCEWQNLHIYNKHALYFRNYSQTITLDDRQTVVYHVKVHRFLLFSKKPHLTVHRSDGSLVGVCRMHHTLFTGHELHFYADESYTHFLTKLKQDGVFTYRNVFKLPGSETRFYWKHTHSHGGTLFGTNYKCEDESGNLVAVYQDVVSVKKDGRLQIKQGLSAQMVDLIVLTVMALMEKVEKEHRHHTLTK